MQIGVIGAGRIGGNIARQLVGAGHEVLISFAREPEELRRRASAIGARAGTVAEAAGFGEVVVLSVPWASIETVLAEAGSLAGKIVIDTTNHYARGAVADLDGRTAAQINQARMPGARLVKAYNTLTAQFQADAAGRPGAERVVMFLCGDDANAKVIAGGLIEDSGFTPFDVGGLADAAVMEAPRRPGAVYGEEFHLAEATRFFATRPSPTRTHATRTIEVRTYEPTAYDTGVDGAAVLTEIHVSETFSGDITGEGVARFLQVAGADGSASFVGVERVTGAIGERSGSFVLQDAGTLQGSTVSGQWFVVPGSGTGELSGLRGEGGFTAEVGQNARITLDYWFDR
jgi:8-hydroxy-5-deazaflavin:NADPH oxidoreductase